MDFKRMILDKKFFLAAVLALAGILIGTSWPDLKWNAEKPSPLSCGTFLSALEHALKSRTVLYLIPITATLPWGDAYLREQQRHFLRLLTLRGRKRDYCRGRALSTALSGALVWMAAVLSSLLLFFLLLYGREELWQYPKEAVEGLLFAAGKICLIASALSSFGAFAGTVSGSSYLALGLPFILYSFGIILRERYLDFLYYIDPSEWILAKNNWGRGQYSLWIFLLLLSLGMALLHLAALERKVETQL